MPRSGARRIPAILLYGSYAAATLAGVVLILTRSSMLAVGVPAMLLYGLIATSLAVTSWRCRRLDRRTRRAWGVIAVAFSLMLVFPVLFGVFNTARFPSPGDVVRLTFTLTLMLGLLMFPLTPTTVTERRKISLDALTVVGGGLITLWYLVVGPGLTATGGSFRTIAAASAYPFADLMLIFSIATVLLRGTDRSTRRPLSMLAAGAGCFVVVDIYLGYVRSHDLPIELINSWPFLGYETAHFLMAAAALQQHVGAGERTVTSSPRLRLPAYSRLPYAAVALGYALMVVAAFGEKHMYPWSGLVLGGIGITALVIIRQVLVQRENHRMAVTDTLTGLANRSQLHQGLERALARAARGGHSTAVILADLNGFKEVNDSLGHRAGDQMLVAFGGMLRRAVLGSDLVARLGGDEFAIVLQNIRGIANAEAVAGRALAEMGQPVMIDDVALTIRASLGIAISGPGELDNDELLHRADQAMYRAKRAKSAGWDSYDPAKDPHPTSRRADPLSAHTLGDRSVNPMPG
jgi:diguanylate cyclase (GGDEF)-like protein